jgi:tetratricopeptide (TPR) repeat protein
LHFNDISGVFTVLDIKREYPKALEFYERAYNLTVNKDHQDDKDIANSATPLANMAYLYRNLGGYDTSRELYSQELEIVEAYFDAELMFFVYLCKSDMNLYKEIQLLLFIIVNIMLLQ